MAPEVALGHMEQMTGAKVMLVVGGRCCQEVPVERGIRQGRPESIDLFVLVQRFFGNTFQPQINHALQ